MLIGAAMTTRVIRYLCGEPGTATHLTVSAEPANTSDTHER